MNHDGLRYADDLVRHGQVHSGVYHDTHLFQQELSRIFATSWVYMGHESEVPEPGDYKRTVRGLEPMLMVRGADDGQIRVLSNRCRHRGALVCQLDRGNSNFLRCPYHAWTYDSTGALVGVPLPKRYTKGVDRDQLSLVPAARTASYRGFVFASAAPDGPCLEEYLGNARPYLDRLAAVEGGILVGPTPQRYTYDGNWKLQLENVVDNYHVTIVHKSFVDILAARTGSRGRWHSGVAKDLGNGHGVMEFPTDTGAATGGEDFNLVIFPNLAFVGYQIRVVQPLAVDRTNVEVWPMLLGGASDEVNGARLRVHEESFGPAGFVSPDDVEVPLGRVQMGTTASSNPWMELSRGLGEEEVLDGGVLVGDITDEIGMRAFYQQWKTSMAAVELVQEGGLL
jgi:phenylpropionate dioxygenase-like ring-hydroxylating dioxygenase large terminal subunit